MLTASVVRREAKSKRWFEPGQRPVQMVLSTLASNISRSRALVGSMHGYVCWRMHAKDQTATPHYAKQITLKTVHSRFEVFASHT